jgi:hypothetical protein
VQFTVVELEFPTSFRLITRKLYVASGNIYSTFINILQIKTQHLPLSSLYVNQHLQLYCGIMNLTGDHNSCFLSSTHVLASVVQFTVVELEFPTSFRLITRNLYVASGNIYSVVYRKLFNVILSLISYKSKHSTYRCFRCV